MKKIFVMFFISVMSVFTIAIAVPYLAFASPIMIDMEKGIIRPDDPYNYYFYGELHYDFSKELLKDSSIEGMYIFDENESIQSIQFPGSKIEWYDGCFIMICPTEIFDPNSEYYNQKFSEIFSDGLYIAISLHKTSDDTSHYAYCTLSADAIDYGTVTDEEEDEEEPETDETLIAPVEDAEYVESENLDDILNESETYTSPQTGETGNGVSLLLTGLIISGAVAYIINKK